MIKEHFTSRYGDKGVLIEADWCQLELIGWAFRTQDPLLLKLINSGQDVHRYIGSKVLKCNPEDITKEVRSQLKPRNFLLVYGGYWTELVRTHGMTEYDAEQLYNTFWDLFPTAKLVQDNWVKSVEANSRIIDEVTPTGLSKREGFYKSCTGRKYYFKSYDYSQKSREYGRKTRFKKAEIYNNDIQGFCTADIHLIALGNLFRKSIEHRDKFLLVNTVHDSVILDCKKDYVDFACKLLKNELEYIKVIMKSRFKLDINLPLLTEVKVGNSWAEMEEYSFYNQKNKIEGLELNESK